MLKGLYSFGRWLHFQGFGNEWASEQSVLKQDAVAVEAKLIEIRKDKVGEGVAVTLKLFRVFYILNKGTLYNEAQ